MIRAGYSAAGGQNRHSDELMVRPRVQARIAELIADMNREIRVEIKDVVNEMARIAFFDIRRLYDDKTGRLKDMRDLDAVSARAVSKVKYKEIFSGGEVVGQTIEYTLVSKEAMLTNLARYLGMFAPDIIVAPEGELAALLRSIDGRSKGPPLLRVITGESERVENVA